jgi:hypothetical protein
MIVRNSARWAISRWDACPTEFGPESVIGYLVNSSSDSSIRPERIVDLITLARDAGCDVNAYSAFGETPLHNAVSACNIRMVQFLKSIGANPALPSIARAPSVGPSKWSQPGAKPVDKIAKFEPIWTRRGTCQTALLREVLLQ